MDEHDTSASADDDADRPGGERDEHPGDPQPSLLQRLGVQWVPREQWQRVATVFDLDVDGRQFQALQGVVGGLSDEQIAEALGITASTVRSHLEKLYQRIRCHSRAEAVAAAWRASIKLDKPS